MKQALQKRIPALLLSLLMLFSLLPVSATALEASTMIVAWEYNKATDAAVDVPATTGSGTLSHSTGDAITAGQTGFFSHADWSTDRYWLLSGINTAGKSNLVLSMRVQGSATGPRNWAVEFSTDAGDTWQTAGSYAITTSTETVKPVISLPDAAISENLMIRLRPSDTESVRSTEETPEEFGNRGTNKIAFVRLYVMEAGYRKLAAFDFTKDNCPTSFPTEATEGWGYLNTTASGAAKLVSENTEKLLAVSVTKWGPGHNWCMIFNTTDTTDLVLEADVLSSGTGPADWAVEYSIDGGSNWVWVQSYHLTPSTTKLLHQTIHLPDEAQSPNLLVRFKVASDTSVGGGNINRTQGTSRINHVTLTGNVGKLHDIDPDSPAWPSGYGDTAGDALPAEAFVGWSFDDAVALPAKSAKGWGYLANSITTGPTYTGGALAIKGWAVDDYWLLVANTTGYTGMMLNAQLGSSGTGPRDLALQYSVNNGADWTQVGDPIRLTSSLQNYEFLIPDAAQAANCLFRFVVISKLSVKSTDATPAEIASGGNSKINLTYLTGTLSGTHLADPVNAAYPEGFTPKQEEVDSGFVNADIKGEMLVGWKFTEATVMPAQPTEIGWGSLSHITSAYCSFGSKALTQTGWTTGAYWQIIANTSGCTDMSFQMKTGSSSTGPKNLSLRYSTDIGETWIEFATLSISETVKNYIVDLPDAAQSDNLIIRVVVADDESIKGDVIKNGGSNKLNNVAIYGVAGSGRLGDPAQIRYPEDWSWPLMYDFDSIYVPENDEAADVTGFTSSEEDRRVIASWGGNANYAGDLYVYGDLVTANDRLDGQAVMSVVVGNENITPGFATSSTNSTNYYLGSKNPCMGSGTIPVDADEDGEPDMTTDENGKEIPVTEPTDDYIQMKVSTAKYTDLALSFRLRVSNAGPSGFTMKYSTDGENFTNFGTGSYSYAYTGYGYGGATYDVSGGGDIKNGYIPMDVGGSYVSVEMDVPQGCENAKDLYIRLYADRTRQTPTTNSEGVLVTTVSKVSSVRIDTVVLSGCPMEHPAISDWVRCELPSSLPAGAALNFSCADPNATVYYSFDYGETVQVYDPADPPLLTEFPALVRVWAGSEDTDYDSVKTYYYFTQAQVSPVKASPNGGAVAAGTDLRFTCPTEGAEILYSTDYGIFWETYDPENRPVLTEELLLDGATVMVMAVKEGCVSSPISILTYTLRQNEFYNLYFGQLHSHTNLSDGAGSCEDAFNHAANQVDNLDFLAVTDHSNAFDNDLQASLQDGSMSSKWRLGHELADKYTTSDFVGLYGYEMTWSNGLGHINTYNTSGFQSRTQTEFASYSTALSNYYTALKGDANSLSQFNHPGTTFGNFQDYAYYDEVIDELITIIEVGNGEGTIGSSGYFPSYEEYTRALDLGWHVAPTNNQDNHKGNWGDSNTARSVVMADSLTRNNIYDAMRNRRVYATEDNDFSVYYTLDDYEMGTILTADDIGDTIHLKALISDPTDNGNVKVDVIVNGGIVAATKSVPVSEATVEFELKPSYSYYYLRLTQSDGNIAVTAPVWIGDVEAIGVKEVRTDADIALQGVPMNITMDFYNDEDAPLYVDSIEFSVGGETVHTVDLAKKGLDVIEGPSAVSYSFPFTYNGIGAMSLEVTVKGTYQGVEKQYNGVLQMDFLPEAMIADVIVDGTHYNDYVTGLNSGNTFKLVKLGLEHYARVRVETKEITAAMLKDCNLLIISAPAKRTMSGYSTSHFSDAFIKMVADYVANGGSVVLCGNSDYNDSTACQSHTEINKLLSAMGATVKLYSDQVAEMNANDTLNYGPILKAYDAQSKWLAGADPERGFSLYSAGSVDVSGNAENTKVYKAQKLIWGNPETFSVDTKTNGGVSINNEELTYFRGKGQVTEVVVQDTKAGGHIFLSGGVFFSDFNMETDEHDMMLNATLMANILENTGVQLPVTPIETMRQGEMGEVFCIEGTVTNGTANEATTFFDTIYVQDATGGVTVYPYSESGLAIGTKVQIVGYKDAYQDDIEIQVIKCKILEDAPAPLPPASLSCADAMDYENHGGELLKVCGTVIDVQYQEGTVTQIKLKDETGIATVFIDGYIYSGTTGLNELADICHVGDLVSAVGLCFMHPEAGSDVSTCCLRVRDCDEILYLGIGEHDHDWGEGVVTTPATCEENGEMTYTCSLCGETRTEVIPATGHSWDDGAVTTPTCTENGEMTYTCTVCGETYTEVIDAPGHNWDEGAVTAFATCTENGEITYTCTVCGETYTEEIDASGHNWDEGAVTTFATCTENGEITYTCTVCGETYTEEIEALGHDYVATVTPPTCENGGYTTYTCSRCGDTYIAEETPALGHTDADEDGVCDTCGAELSPIETEPSTSEPIVTEPSGSSEPTDTEPSESSEPINTEPSVSSEPISTEPSGSSEPISTEPSGSSEPTDTEPTEPSKPIDTEPSESSEPIDTEPTEPSVCLHENITLCNETPATCLDSGYTGDVCCADCGAVLAEGIVLEALGHNWGEGEADPPATCEEDGMLTFTCDRCGETHTEVIEATGHNYVSGTCTNCGEADPDYDPICPHENTELRDVKDATCTEDGYTGDTWCTDCGARLAEGTVIEAAGHSWDEGTVTAPATCTSEGAITYTCTVCGETKTEALSAFDCPSLKFDDLDISLWYHEAVDFMLLNGLMTGTTTSAPFLFKPFAPTTRAMLVTILNSAEGHPTADIENPFTDVFADKWYLPYVLWGYDNGVIAGYGDGRFGPDDNVTREQIAVILYSYSLGKGEDVSASADLSRFPDENTVSTWARTAVEWAVANGLITGRSNGGVTTLSPKAEASRAEIAAILRSYFQNYLSVSGFQAPAAE